MNEEFAVTAEMLRKRPEMARDGWKVGAEDPGPPAARALQPLHAARRRGGAGAGGRARRSRRALHAPHARSRPPARSRCRWRTMPRNGIEPSFAHHYFRNVIREGKKTQGEGRRLLVRAAGLPRARQPDARCRTRRSRPRSCRTTSSRPTTSRRKEHVDIQAAAQKWVDSSISKTANVPTDYRTRTSRTSTCYAHEQGLKGCTTFRFNPEAFQGVLVKEEDLKNTTYVFTLEDGTRGRGQGRRGDRVRRRDAHRRQSVRRAEGRLLRQVLSAARNRTMSRHQDRQEDRQVPRAEAGREGRGRSSRAPARDAPRGKDGKAQGHPHARGDPAPRGADRLHLQDQDAGLGSRDVRDDQRHRAERGHASTSSAGRSRSSSTRRTSITSSGSSRSRASSPRCSARAATSRSWSTS